MSLFQFKVSSLSRQKDSERNFFGNSLAPTSSSTIGKFPKKAEEPEIEASQFIIDEEGLWDDDDEDVFEPSRKSKKESKPTLISPEKSNKVNETFVELVEDIDEFSEQRNDEINESVHYKDKTEVVKPDEEKKKDEIDFNLTDDYSYQKPAKSEICFDLVDGSDDEINESVNYEDKTEVNKPDEEKKEDEIDFNFTDNCSYQKPAKSEICFDLVDGSDDDVICPNSPKSPTFHLSNKSRKKSSSSNLKKSDLSSETYSGILTNNPRTEKNITQNSSSFNTSRENVNPLGLGKETDLWLNEVLKNEAFSSVSSETSEEKLQNNLTFLNKSYVDILEKVMAAFESLPVEFLSQFPEFDPNVFITLRTTRRRIKAVIIKTENLLKRKNSTVGLVESGKENKNSDCFEVETPVTRDFSRLRYSTDLNSFDENCANHSSEGLFSFKQTLKSRNASLVDDFPVSSPAVGESKRQLGDSLTDLNFPVVDSPKPDVMNSFTSSTPSLKPNPLNSSFIDYTDMLYKTPPKSCQKNTTFAAGKFPATMRNDGASGEFDGLNFPHSKELLDKFRQKFGLRTFRTNQLQVINAALLGFDCFVLMPTGGGKSLCYQLPALVSRGVTVVVSPLRSLILDQVTKLLNLDIAAAHLSGDLKESEMNSVYRKLNQPEPKIKLLYVTPEKVGASSCLRNCLFGLYKRQMLARFVIDEAHCVSQWGHDFRPDYKKLRELRENFPDVNTMALTATATPRVRSDILHQLKVANPKWFLSSFNRSNLVYSVREKKGKSTLKEVATLIQNEFKKDTGVIYCFSRKECEDVAKSLKDYGIAAVPYHAGLNDDERTRAQNSWMNDKVKVVCATIAFGMGIDKLDVRFVIHYSLPKSIEGYYQESGRAGRDGEKATCILYYCYRDRIRMLKLINMDQSMANQAARKVHIDNLFRVAAFAENKTDCRRALQLEYFGEKFDRKNCIENRATACDNCLNQGIYETIDVTNESKAIVSAIKEVCGKDDKRSSNFTMLHFVDVFKGTVLKKVLSEGHDTLPMYGVGKSWQRLDVERLFRKLIMEEFIKERLLVKDDGITFAYLKFGPRGEELLKGNIKIMFEVKKQKGSSSAQSVVRTEKRIDPAVLEVQEKCYSELMDAIHAIASSVNCNPNAIMNVQALRAMSSNLPETAEEMLSINHVTTANFEKYGNILLEITRKYAEDKKLLEITEVPEDLFASDPWESKSRDESPYFETDITFEGKGKGGRKRKRANNPRKTQGTKKWKGGGGSSRGGSSSKYTGGRNNAKSSGSRGQKDDGSGVKTVPGAKLLTLMELPTNKARGFDRPKVILKNL